MLLNFGSHANSIKGMPGHCLLLWSVGPIVNKGLESESILTFKHHLQLLPACAPVISLKDFQVVKCPGIEDFPVLQMMGGIKVEFWSFLVVIGVRGIAKQRKAGELQGNYLTDWRTRRVIRSKGELLTRTGVLV